MCNVRQPRPRTEKGIDANKKKHVKQGQPCAPFPKINTNVLQNAIAQDPFLSFPPLAAQIGIYF